MSIFYLQINTITMSLFDEFKIDYVNQFEKKVENKLMEIVENELYPKLVDKIKHCLLARKLVNNSKEIEILVNKDDMDFPTYIVIDNIKIRFDSYFDYFKDLQTKYTNMMLDMFISEYNQHKNLVKLNHEYVDNGCLLKFKVK